MSLNSLQYAVDQGVALITLDRPDKLNSFDRAMSDSLVAALDQARDDKNVRAVVITGAGRAFCAGQDLAEAIAPGARIEEIVEKQYNAIIGRIRALPKPVLAAVNGVAAGAGANIAYACDLTLAAEGANFIQSFINIGLIPDSGGTWTLPRTVGLQHAFAQTVLADKLSAAQVAAQGLIWRTVPGDQLLEETLAIARRLATMPTLAIALTKQALEQGLRNTLLEQLKVEGELQAIAGRSYDSKEGVAAFLEKRKPVFKGE